MTPAFRPQQAQALRSWQQHYSWLCCGGTRLFAQMPGRRYGRPRVRFALELLLSPDGTRLYVLCQQSEEVRVLNATSFAVLKNIPVGRAPRGFSLSASGDRLFVTNSWDDTLS